MKKITRLLALLLVLVFALSACGTPGSSAEPAAEPADSTVQAEPTEAPPPADQTPMEAPSAEEPSAVEPETPEVVISYPLFDTTKTYTIWLGTAPDLSDVVSNMEEFVIFRELEKITNVTWDATMVSFMAEAESFQLMVAGGDYTDVVCKAVDNYNGTVDQAIEDEFLIDLAPYIPENMPNLTRWFNEYPELPKQLTSEGGAIGAFPKIYKEPSDISSGGMIRADWLEDLGLEAPKTYDDMYNVLKEFRDKKDATAPLVIAMPSGVQSELLAGYNITGGFYQVDGRDPLRRHSARVQGLPDHDEQVVFRGPGG